MRSLIIMSAISLLLVFPVCAAMRGGAYEPPVSAEDLPKSVAAISNMEWPFDAPIGYENYAQQAVFDTNAPFEWLQEAIKLYNEGYEIISQFEIRRNKVNPYNVDPYHLEVNTPTDLSMRRRIDRSLNLFSESADIISRKLVWDTRVTGLDVYKSLLVNTYHNLVIGCIYNKYYGRAMENIDTYEAALEVVDGEIPKEERKWILLWRIRTLTILIARAEKYDFVYVGDKSAASLRILHRHLIEKAINEEFADDENMKKELLKRFYPPETMQQYLSDIMPAQEAETTGATDSGTQ